jgi:hypothetical protein|tara:strand:- start:1855 stop:2121 length:267 start_codon:yes stop_codon:yes gene_type:complete
MIENKVVRVSLSGGLIGSTFTNPTRALNRCMAKHNKEGWRFVFKIPHKQRNIFMLLLENVILVATIGMWTFDAGYLVTFERNINEDKK